MPFLARAEVAKNLGIEAGKRRQVQQQVTKLETDLEQMQQIITESERVLEGLQEAMENETVNEAHVERLIQQELPSGAWDTVLAVLYLILLMIVAVLGHAIRKAQGTIKQQIDLEEEELGNTIPRPEEARRSWSRILKTTQCGMDKDTPETADIFTRDRSRWCVTDDMCGSVPPVEYHTLGCVEACNRSIFFNLDEKVGAVC